MKCPKCKKEMKVREESITNNQKTGNSYKEYAKMVYWCEDDDIWISAETPM